MRSEEGLVRKIKGDKGPMNSCKGNTVNKIRPGLIFFTAVFAFILVYIPCIRSVVYAEILEREAAVDREKEMNIVSEEQSSVEGDIAVEVNGEVITTQELLRQYDLFFIMSEYSAEYRERVTLDSYLDTYVLKLLLFKEAGKAGIRVGRDEVEEEKKIYLGRTGLTEDTLSKNLLNAGLSMEDADRYFQNYIIIDRLGDKKFGDIEISDEESREFYSGNPEYFDITDKITVSHILICHTESLGCESGLTRQEAKEKAEYIRKLARPENFSNLAKQYSMDPTGASGGTLGKINRGMAVSSFEDAAFKLEIGEISDVVETDYGYHIIHVNGKEEARLTFEETKESIKRKLKKERIQSRMLAYSEQLRKEADIRKHFVADAEGKKGPETEARVPEESGNVIASGDEFPTFRYTGRDICTNDEGLPVIILFTSSGCSHCEWIGETFDSVVMEYVDSGLIEAHHYDIDYNKDLLMPDLETEIPQSHFEIKKRGDPEGYIPYFNFGCRYDRIGTGYEYQDDLFAEEMEMRQVIDALLR